MDNKTNNCINYHELKQQQENDINELTIKYNTYQMQREEEKQRYHRLIEEITIVSKNKQKEVDELTELINDLNKKNKKLND